jgi:hypothetical protein
MKIGSLVLLFLFILLILDGYILVVNSRTQALEAAVVDVLVGYLSGTIFIL